jgi:HlyD family secretion protein
MKTILFLTIAALLIACNNQNKKFDNADATGTFEADEVVVSAQANGLINELYLAEGQTFNYGDTVGYIDSTQLHLSKLQLIQNIQALNINKPNVNEQLAPLKTQIDKQLAEKERLTKLIDAGAATTKQLDDLLANINVTQQQLQAQQTTMDNNVASIQAQINALQIQIQQVEDMLAKSLIITPLQGTVLAKYASKGELANIGKPLFKMADIQHVFLKAYFTSEQLANVKIGQNVNVVADFGNTQQKNYQGIISWISDKSEFTPKNIQTKNERANLVYCVKINVQNDGFIKLGMYGEVFVNN